MLPLYKRLRILIIIFIVHAGEITSLGIHVQSFCKDWLRGRGFGLSALKPHLDCDRRGLVGSGQVAGAPTRPQSKCERGGGGGGGGRSPPCDLWRVIAAKIHTPYLGGGGGVM